MASLRTVMKSGHPPTLFAAFLYFDFSFMVWVLLGPLGVAIAKDLHLSPAQKGLMVAVPLLAGAFLRLVNGVLVDHIGPKRTGLFGQFDCLMNDVELRAEALRTGDRYMNTEQRAGQHERVAHVVAVADIGEANAFERAKPLFEGEEVGQRLARMLEVRQRVDHGYA